MMDLGLVIGGSDTMLYIVIAINILVELTLENELTREGGLAIIHNILSSYLVVVRLCCLRISSKDRDC